MRESILVLLNLVFPLFFIIFVSPPKKAQTNKINKNKKTDIKRGYHFIKKCTRSCKFEDTGSDPVECRVLSSQNSDTGNNWN